MFIDTFARFARLDERIRHPLFDLTVDLGHVHCIEDGPVADHVRAWGPRIANVHIEDMKRGVHDHLMFGEGTMDFPPILQALRDVRLRRRPARRAQPPQPHGRRGRAPRGGVPQPAARVRSTLSRIADPPSSPASLSAGETHPIRIGNPPKSGIPFASRSTVTYSLIESMRAPSFGSTRDELSRGAAPVEPVAGVGGPRRSATARGPVIGLPGGPSVGCSWRPASSPSDRAWFGSPSEIGEQT